YGQQLEVVRVFPVQLRDLGENVVSVLVERGARRARAARGVELERGAGRVAEAFVRVDLDAPRVRDGDELEAVNEQSLLKLVRHAQLVATVPLFQLVAAYSDVLVRVGRVE